MYLGSKFLMLHCHCSDDMISRIAKQCAKEPEVLMEAGGRKSQSVAVQTKRPNIGTRPDISIPPKLHFLRASFVPNGDKDSVLCWRYIDTQQRTSQV